MRATICSAKPRAASASIATPSTRKPPGPERATTSLARFMIAAMVRPTCRSTLSLALRPKISRYSANESISKRSSVTPRPSRWPIDQSRASISSNCSSVLRPLARSSARGEHAGRTARHGAVVERHAPAWQHHGPAFAIDQRAVYAP